MERRKALKNLGLGTASVFTGSLLFSALQSCSRQSAVDWEPRFFTKEEAAQMERICEAILPASDTPGATDAGVVPHLDESVFVMDSEREKNYLRQGLKAFIARFEPNVEVPFDEATREQIGQGVNGYLRGMSRNNNLLQNYFNDLKDNKEKSLGFFEIHFVYTVVNASIWSYLTSELVGETVMAYDPIPGEFNGCTAYDQTARAWSYL